ncbi:hypothetical protein DJ90_914 [Paenibacillus macerans]|uniref:Uncharacterized protein n=1 Tax=Paenibacillus macerans TaxID=44252 RepID=A0A090ZIM2_PAEMA|nr:hypothetical protein DJ90_914 [Paenibacillus macerans]
MGFANNRKANSLPCGRLFFFIDLTNGKAYTG